jgi:hypothetical protein
MAKTVEVDLQVNNNLEPTIKNLRELKKQLRETAAGTKQFDELSASIRDMEDAISDAKATNDDFLGQLENASGPLGTLGQGIRAAERTFSSFNGALKASIIGAIVALVAGLAAAFSNNEKAQKKLQPIMEAFEKILGGVFAVVEPLFDVFIDLATKALPYVSDAFKVVYSSVTAVFQSLGKLGSAVKKLIGGDFSGAWDDAKSSVTGFSKNFNDAKTRFEKGSNEMTALEKENAAKRAEAIEKENERKKAAAEKAAEEERERREKELQERREYIEKQKEIDEELNNNLDALKISQEEKKDAQFLSDIEKNNAKNLKLIEDDNLRTAAEETLASTRAEIAAQEYAFKISQANQAAATLSQLSELAGRETAAGKALGIASATINTYVGVSEALKQKSTLPSPFDVVAKVVNVATVLATGFKAVKAISSVKVPGGGGGGAAPTPISVSGGAAASVPAAAPTFNVVGTSGQNQIAQSLGNQQPVKAYVVANDVSTQQSLDRNIVKTATIGG